MKNILIILSLISSYTTLGHAFYSTMETGDLVEDGKYRATLYPQWNLNGEYSGVTAMAAFETGINESSSVRVYGGTGRVDFVFGGSYKWVPIPDVDNQPAIGVTGGALYANFEAESILAVRITPIASKRFEIDFGEITPYVSLPLGFTFFDGDTFYPLNLAGGADLKLNNLEDVTFLTELAFSLHDSFSYVTLGATYTF